MEKKSPWGQPRPAGETAVFQCPRCQSQSTCWRGAVSYVKVGRSCSAMECQECHKSRLTNVSYPMTLVEVK
jgi:transcription elongation factor Elf1